MNRNLKSALTYGLAFVLLAFAGHVIYNSFDLEKLQSISIDNFYPLLAFSFITFILSGLYYYTSTRISFNIQLDLLDLVTLPFTINFFSYLIPFQGSTLYSTAFYKIKYKLQTSKGLSITLFSYALSVSFTGLLGIYFSVGPKTNQLLLLVSLLLTLNPLLLIAGNWVLQKHILHYFKHAILFKIANFTANTLDSFQQLVRNKTLLITVIVYNLLHSLSSIAWFYFAAKALTIEATLAEIAFLALFTKLSLILRVTPGNLGVEQLLSGALFGLAGANIADGMAISVLVKTSALLNTIVFGSLGIVFNLKYFKFSSIAELTQALKSNSKND